MSDTNNTDDKSGNRSGGHTLSLKRPAIEQSRVKQNFAHGRTKTVVVETKRKRFGDDKPAPAPVVEDKPKVAPPARVIEQTTVRVTAPTPPRAGMVLRTLSADEREARERALADSRVREAQDRKRQEEDAVRRKAQDEHDRICLLYTSDAADE